MAKFTKARDAVSPMHWGPAYCGGGPPLLTRQEERLREKILDHSYPESHARLLVEHLDGEALWMTTTEFVEALAAHSALFSE